MRTHPIIGSDLLSRFEGLSVARNLVLQHHERWDGSGYPQGLKGEEITIGARLFAIADTLEAMLSERPYRASQDLDSSIEELREGSGSLFDPMCIEAFDKVPKERWTRIRLEIPDL